MLDPSDSESSGPKDSRVSEPAADLASSSSQPWPYPANLMVGCFGRAKPDQTIRLDLDNELEGKSQGLLQHEKES